MDICIKKILDSLKWGKKKFVRSKLVALIANMESIFIIAFICNVTSKSKLVILIKLKQMTKWTVECLAILYLPAVFDFCEPLRLPLYLYRKFSGLRHFFLWFSICYVMIGIRINGFNFSAFLIDFSFKPLSLILYLKLKIALLSNIYENAV